MSNNKPTDIKLYNTIKNAVYKKITKHSAYRSGRVVMEYKKAFVDKYGKRKSPYTGKYKKDEGLRRWFDEDWRNQRGDVGYREKGDVYRPTKRITKDTPTTFSELSQTQIKRAIKEKKKKGRVKKFE